MSGRRPPARPADPAALNVLVMGMHRSGTSALATALAAAGLAQGEAAEEWAPNADNPLGFGERRDVVALNDRLLQSLGWTWSSPSAAPLAVAPERPQLVEDGRALVAGRLRPAQPWSIKDPRLSLLLPWWRQILLDRFVAVVTVRPPQEVAWSLSVRNGFPTELGLALWAAYHRHLAQGLEGLPVLVVDYVSLVQDPPATIGGLMDGLRAAGVEAGLDAEAAMAAIHPSLRRATAPERDREPALHAAVQELASAWSMGRVAFLERFAMECDRPSPWEEAILQVHRTARREEARAETAIAASSAARADAVLAEAATNAARAEVDQLRSRLAEAEAERRAAQDATRAARSLALASQAARNRELDELRARADRLELDHERVTRLAHELRAEIAPLRASRVASDAQAAVATRRAEQLVDELVVERRLRAATEQQLAGERDQRASLEQRLASLAAELEAAQAMANEASAAADRMLLDVYRQTYVARIERRRRWRVPWMHRLFDAEWYRTRYPDVAAGRLPAYWHFSRHGRHERRDPNAHFDGRWYLARYPDVAEQGIDALDHYASYGAAEGRDPSPSFSTLGYLRSNPQLLASGLNPLEHALATRPRGKPARARSSDPSHGQRAQRAWSYLRRYGTAAFARKAAHKVSARWAVSSRGDANGGTLPAEVAPQAIHASLDLPAEGASESSIVLTVAGWACSESGIGSISLFIDGSPSGRSETGLPRPDVAEALASMPDAARAGFSTSLRIDGLAEGTHELAVAIADRAGNVRLIRRSFQRMTAARLYHHYYERMLPGADELRALQRRVGRRHLPQLTIWVEATGELASRTAAAATLESIAAQDYPAVRCVVLVDESRRAVVESLLAELAERGGSFSVVTSPADFAAAEPGYIAVLRAGETLAPHALVPFVSAAIETDSEIVYSDHDSVEASGRHVDPQIAPDYSPDHLLSRDYVGGFFLARASAEACRLAQEARATGRRAWRYDLLLRLLDREPVVTHVPRILWSSPAGGAAVELTTEEETAIVEEALRRRSRAADVTAGAGGIRRVRWDTSDRPKVSIIIPTTGRLDHLRPCVESILERTTYERYELLFIDNGRGAHPDGIDYLRSQGLRVLERNEPFNWAKLNNDGAAATDGELLLFLNDDVEVRDGEWLTELVAQASRPGVGTVGAMLLFPDGTIQHAGIFLVGHGGGAMHFFHHQDPDGEVYLNLHRATREVAANTGACLMVSRALFEQVGGFDTDLAVVGNDVDLCLRVLEQGYRNVWTPHAVLIHHESVSRGALSIVGDESKMWARWSSLLRRGDPYFSPHFAQDRPDCVIAWDRPAPGGNGRKHADAAAAADAGLNLIGYIRAEMGVGQATRGDAMALSQAGVPFVIIDYSDGNPSRMADETWLHRLAARPAFDVNLVRINADNIVAAAQRLGSDVFDGRYTIGAWAWELPEFPDRWRPAFQIVDEVWAPSRFVQDAIAAKSPVPVTYIPHAIQAPGGPFYGRQHFGLPNDRFQLLMMYDVHSLRERKNPEAAIRAFVSAFDAADETVALVIKVNNGDRHEERALRELIAGRSNVFVIDRVLDRREVDSLVFSSDCYVSLHRAEGFGLPIAEAMALGKPVIATSWSGNADFMDDDSAACVGYRLVEIERSVGPYDAGQTWAEPDIGQAAAWMRRLRGDAELARALGERGRARVERDLSPRRVGQLMAERLAEIRQERPTRLAARDRQPAPPPPAIAASARRAARRRTKQQPRSADATLS